MKYVETVPMFNLCHLVLILKQHVFQQVVEKMILFFSKMYLLSSSNLTVDVADTNDQQQLEQPAQDKSQIAFENEKSRETFRH